MRKDTTQRDLLHSANGRGVAQPPSPSSPSGTMPAITTPSAIAGAPDDTDPDAESDVIAGSQTRLLDRGTGNGRASVVGRALADDREVVDADLPANRYLDRELSWLAFNNRVLALTKD